MQMPHLRLASHAIAGLVAACSLSTFSPAAHATPSDGPYVGLGLGYAMTSGQAGQTFEDATFSNLAAGSDAYRDVVNTDFGEGLGFELRFGWMIGAFAPEIGLLGHGSTSFDEGAGYPMFTLRIHPLRFVELLDIPFDFNVFAGAGYAIGGYSHVGDDEKGWEGWSWSVGAGATVDVTPGFRVGLDLRAILPQYDTFLYDWDDDITFTPTETATATVFLPSLQLIGAF
jgi:hypothetical protein